MSRFQGISLTTLPDAATAGQIQTEVRKALLDLLKNDNALYFELLAESGSDFSVQGYEILFHKINSINSFKLRA